MPSIIEFAVYRFDKLPGAANNNATSLASGYTASYARNLASIEFD